jgi:hypothetical protein
LIERQKEANAHQEREAAEGEAKSLQEQEDKRKAAAHLPTFLHMVRSVLTRLNGRLAEGRLELKVDEAKSTEPALAHWTVTLSLSGERTKSRMVVAVNATGLVQIHRHASAHQIGFVRTPSGGMPEVKTAVVDADSALIERVTIDWIDQCVGSKS